jgi:hypothetical protein
MGGRRLGEETTMLTCRFLQTTAAAALLAGTAHATDAAGTADPATAAEASGTQQGFGLRIAA